MEFFCNLAGRWITYTAAALGRARGKMCPEPTIVLSYYTTADAVISLESVFVMEITLTCCNGAQNVALYHKATQSGTYKVKFFDEESYSALHKAQRNNKDVLGTWSRPWVSTEVLAAAIGLLVYYLALSAKGSIQA
uniref:Translocon-associated protein subunit delta n=1 Tax=Gopherus evgoodei TaxID=1825980 RepID=A0A8C4Y2R0_9SAUR